MPPTTPRAPRRPSPLLSSSTTHWLTLPACRRWAGAVGRAGRRRASDPLAGILLARPPRSAAAAPARPPASPDPALPARHPRRTLPPQLREWLNPATLQITTQINDKPTADLVAFIFGTGACTCTCACLACMPAAHRRQSCTLQSPCRRPRCRPRHPSHGQRRRYSFRRPSALHRCLGRWAAAGGAARRRLDHTQHMYA